MNKEHSLLTLTTNKTELSLYDTLKSLCQKYSEKITGSDKCNVKKLLFESYEVLLKKVDSNHKAIPTEWRDEDILNALYLHICEYADDERAQQIRTKFHNLYENQNTEIYKNSIGPVIKMLYSVAISESNAAKKKKFYRLKNDNWFDPEDIFESLHNIKKYLPNEDIKFFTLPKIYSSQSDNNLSLLRPFQLPSSLTFDCIFENGNLRQEKLSYDLDEGFVTPSEEHKERSPCMDKKIAIPTKKSKQFDWDLKVVGVPPRKDKSWEKLDLHGRNEELPFVPKQVHLQYWLSKAPHSITKISREQLIEDLMSLLIGVPSTTFSFNGKTFVCKAGVYTDHHTTEDVLTFTKQYIEAAEAFLDLKTLSEKNLSDDIITTAFKLAIKKYLYNYQLIIYHLINGRSNNKAYLSDVQSLIEQVIYLKKILIQPEELKGVALLEQLFSNMETSSSQIFYLLTSLFLQPCQYYFRLIDDWIFLGKWHKDLPISPSDFSLIEDRQSWEEAYKPIQSNFLSFIPLQDLAYCGKALCLLGISKNSEKFLKILKSDDKPRIKVCLNLGELKQLQIECHNFYERAKSSFQSKKEEKLDLVSCAHDSAKMKAQTFEELKKGKMDIEKERKRKELNLREEDLIRSAKVRELKKQEEEIDNIRVANQLEEMFLKEEKREFEKAKEIISILKQEQAEEERKGLKAEWKLKREENSKKRQEFFNDNALVSDDDLIQIEIGSKESVIDKRPETDQNKDCNEDTFQVPLKPYFLQSMENIQESQSNNEDENKIDTPLDVIKHSELKENRSKVLGSNFIVGDGVPTWTAEKESKENEKIATPSQVPNLVETTATTKDDIKYSELEENKLKVLGSHFTVGDDLPSSISEEVGKKNYKITSEVLNLVETTVTDLRDDIIKHSELEENKLKVLGSNFIVGDDLPSCKSEEVGKKNHVIASEVLNFGEATAITKDDIKYSDLEGNKLKVLGSNFTIGDDLSEVGKKSDEIPSTGPNLTETTNFTTDGNLKYSELTRNRMKALHSDFERVTKRSLLLYQDEAGKNKEKILGSHFTLGSELKVEKFASDEGSINISQTNKNMEGISQDEIKSSKVEKMTESIEFKENILQHSLDSENIRLVHIRETSNDNLLPIIEDQNNLPCNNINNQTEATSEHIGVNGVNWFQKCNLHVEGVKNLFKANDLVNLPEQQLDYCSILRCVPGSLNLVLETQLKLVNEALLEMFFNEFHLLTEAGKLKKYFFLDEEFGKRLSCSLCPAIEKEKPLTLLTFGRLRDVLAFASLGDEKLSFIVKETPTAFEHTNPQVLSCLGLSYKFTWPLNLIFTDIAMSKYNDVFEYMLSIQRVSWHLDQVWLLLKFRSSQMKGTEYTQIQLYRHIMSQFICSLQWYICTTVFENCWQKFKKDVMEVTNFQEVYRKHAAYLKEVIFKCFLNEKSSGLMKKMQSLLKYVLIFCQVMRFGEWSISESGNYQHCNFVKLQNTFSSFLKLARPIQMVRNLLMD
ncbi:gamma-tubulin complex component 6 isoform X2 [Halyomorpha halys]|uniref:gamma-tubulin complex component 6 isoform X2 n=1 Tax=Halyomorpha halys TaxID=286706 RepID=UPI0006D4DDF3|nr:uncharacterized protein LOC106682111 isoform X2 [Halyomorpha halys]